MMLEVADSIYDAHHVDGARDGKAGENEAF